MFLIVLGFDRLLKPQRYQQFPTDKLYKNQSVFKKKAKEELNVKENSFCNAGELKTPIISNYFKKFLVEQVNFVKMDFLLL